MRNSLFIVLFALLAGALSGPLLVDYETTTTSQPIIKPKECAREGTLRVFRFSDASNTPLFCECLPGFDGRYCEKRICKNGVVRIVAIQEVENPDSWYPDLVTTTDCFCNPGFRGPTCEERFERKPVHWRTVCDLLEPIAFFILFMIPCCLAIKMAIEFCRPLFPVSRYTMVYQDVEAMMRPKPDDFCSPARCPYRNNNSHHLIHNIAPPAYVPSFSEAIVPPTVSQPTVVSPISDLRQPVYTQAKIFPHV